MREHLSDYLRYVNYLSAAQLYLKDNFFLREPLKPEHIKDRILGHWGTVPGQNFIYAQVSSLIARNSQQPAASSQQQKNKNQNPPYPPCSANILKSSIKEDSGLRSSPEIIHGERGAEYTTNYQLPTTNWLFVSGPGHGAPAVLANLFTEGTLEKFYPELTRDAAGTGKFIKMFSWPSSAKATEGRPTGFPSHCNPGTPGTILEGGELGYSLSTSFGSVFDHPDLITVCVVGDGEAETGPLATSWQSVKFLNPATSGAVLPILHLNGYKITGPTIFGCMSDEEIASYFTGLGWEPVFVEVGEEKLQIPNSKFKKNQKSKNKKQKDGTAPLRLRNTIVEYRSSLHSNYQQSYRKMSDKGGLPSEASAKEGRGDFSNDHAKMAEALDYAYDRILEIQKKWRSQSSIINHQSSIPPPRWPVIILRSPKGWTGVKELHGKKVEGTEASHGIPLQNPKTDAEEFALLKHWLESYRVTELVDDQGRPLPKVLDVLPSEEQRMGRCKYAFGGEIRESLRLPEISNDQCSMLNQIPNSKFQIQKKQKIKNKKQKVSLRPASETSSSRKPVLDLFQDAILSGAKEPSPIYQIPYTKYDSLASSTMVLSDYLAEVIRLNPRTFRFFCPDETESNKFTSIFNGTDRAWITASNHMWHVQQNKKQIRQLADKNQKIQPPNTLYDIPYTNCSPDGRVMEMLSEHTLQGWLQGYLLTGGHGVFVTYEAFAMVVASMVDQYAKFLKQSKKHKWRKPIASLNYILTSVGWRQEHNGYSHQNPSFISNILEKHGNLASVYFPCDATSATVILEDCLKRTDGINIIVVNKAELPQWLTVEEAREELKTGVGIWDDNRIENWNTRTSSDLRPSPIKPGTGSSRGKDESTRFLGEAPRSGEGVSSPNVVFAAAGDIFVGESIAAITLLEKFLPDVNTRFVNVSELTALGLGDERYPMALDDRRFTQIFTKDRPVIFAFHGYPGTIKQLLWNHANHARFSIHGYQEEGTTTTPFDMLVVNRASRYHLVLDALSRLPKANVREKTKAKKYCEEMLKKHAVYIRKFGKDMEEVG